MEWVLRKAVHSDSRSLADCMHAAYQMYNARMGGKSLPPMFVNYEAEIDQYPVWIAEADGKLAGAIILDREKAHLSVANIAVHPEFQGMGLGRKLLDLAESEARKGGFSEMQLATHVLLTENLALYSHLGWVETGRDEMRVYMTKRLT